MEIYGGEFPTHHTELIKLKGIGPYTARAIGSFAFDNPTGVIDGNVLRVMSRYLGDPSPINEPATRKKFQAIIDTWVENTDSRAFNHGIMDIGSVVCTPQKPGCLLCPISGDCVAYQQGMTGMLPVKRKNWSGRPVISIFTWAITPTKNFAVRQRDTSGFWGGTVGNSQCGSNRR